MHFDRPWPPWTHWCLCQQALLAFAWLWNHVPGFLPWDEDLALFAALAAPFMLAVCLTAGFAVYCVASERRLGWQILKPVVVMIIACFTPVEVLAAMPSAIILRELGFEGAQPWWTIATGITMYAAMLASLVELRWQSNHWYPHRYGRLARQDSAGNWGEPRNWPVYRDRSGAGGRECRSELPQPVGGRRTGRQ